MIEKSLKLLKNKKNLLAFSGGVDSTALFFLLLDFGVKFDIAIVDYGLREQSKDEVAYAKELAKTYSLACHNFTAKKIDKNFEAKAREIRYDFFHKLINEYGYENLITAHHLGDRFEWMLMQFCKGSGAIELLGMREFEKRQNHNLIRPLLHVSKNELLAYLHAKSIKYFQDDTNTDESYKRNYFRANFATPLLEKYRDGIEKSFAYLEEDIELFMQEVKIKTINEFAYFSSTCKKRVDIYHIDRYLKTKGYALSGSEKEQLKHKDTFIVGRKFVINFDKNFVFICPFIQADKMDKKFKEKCRILKIEPKLRGYLYENQHIIQEVF